MRDELDQGIPVYALGRLLGAPLDSRDPLGPRERIEGIILGTFVALRDLYEPLVIYPRQPGTAALLARTTIDLGPEHVGREVVLAFEDGDPQRPIVTGLVRKPTSWPAAERPRSVEIEADDRRLVASAKEQIILKCGKASITLTAAGKVLIQGAYVSHRSSGVMRIKGGSVQIN